MAGKETPVNPFEVDIPYFPEKEKSLVVVPIKRHVLLGDEFVEVKSTVVLGEDKSRKK